MVSEVTAVPTLALTPLGIERLLIQVEVEPESNEHKSGACSCLEHQWLQGTDVVNMRLVSFAAQPKNMFTEHQ